ncbi:LOW QUALITY PROTEIN: wee1-like protein kinase 1-A [Phymastichus coffea]|uniref:LOW QUALITY PROTEIN: wee1-like protein kinase 1-A n=1 Tax=Phymastichus coffea TaxID=108790 RepID=UPI00273C2205|nr:LOW QUALITY PROTEIN: wee1-like protein kinase 1-A [Phymastichus coffea]
MACVNSLCRRFKAIFLSSSHNNAEEIEDHEETVQLIFTVNPFAPIAEDDYKIENETTISRQSTQKVIYTVIIRHWECKESPTQPQVESVKESPSTLPPTSLSTTLELLSTCTTRDKHEFHELNLIGSGEFGSVYRCINRLDGRVYAIKRSRRLLESNHAQRRAKNEVHTNAVLNNRLNDVRYYSAWVEDNRMNIQQEYCNGGNLAASSKTRSDNDKWFMEEEVCRILLDIAKGLWYIRGSKLAHMDIKPKNILLLRERV